MPWRKLTAFILMQRLKFLLFFLQFDDLDGAVERRETARNTFRESVSPETLQQAFCRIMPHPVRSRYTAITFSPQLPLAVRAIQSLQTTQGKILWSVGVCTVLTAAFCVLRKLWSRRR